MLHGGKFYNKLGIPTGTSFPTDPAPVAGQAFYRTDLLTLYIYTGAAWVSQDTANDRLDNKYGINSLSVPIQGFMKHPSSPHALDEENEGSDWTTGAPWGWITTPASVFDSCGYQLNSGSALAYFRVYMYGPGTGEAELRLTTTLPRYKAIHCDLWDLNNALFTMRSVVDTDNWIGFRRDANNTIVEKRVAASTTTIATIATGSMPLILWLGNGSGFNFLTWYIYRADSLGTLVYTAGDAGQQAASVNYLQLKWRQPNFAGFSNYYHKFVRFSS